MVVVSSAEVGRTWFNGRDTEGLAASLSADDGRRAVNGRRRTSREHRARGRDRDARTVVVSCVPIRPGRNNLNSMSPCELDGVSPPDLVEHYVDESDRRCRRGGCRSP